MEDTDEYGSNEETDLDNVSDEDDSGYSITVKVGLDTDEAEKIIHDMRENFQREFFDMFGLVYKPYPYLFGYHPMIFG